jgi:anti-sigma B factor antagonist
MALEPPSAVVARGGRCWESVRVAAGGGGLAGPKPERCDGRRRACRAEARTLRWAEAGVKLTRDAFFWSVSMQIEERKVGEVVVLDLKGKITLGEGDELLKDKVNSLVNQGHRKVVLNLADVPYIDSAGLGEIVRTYTTVSRQGGSLKLLNLTKRITDLLSITKLLTVFETYESEDDAVRSFSASAKV